MEERRYGPAVKATCSENSRDTHCQQALRRLRTAVENLKSTNIQVALRLQPLTGDLCKPPSAVKPPEKQLVPFAAELEDICDQLSEIEHDLNFTLNHVEL